MSKPEPPKKFDPLPAPRPADAKKAEPKKTGWEPPTPQKVRSSERKMGMLLAVSLLAAIGFVAYRKYDEVKSRPATNPNAFAALNGKDAKPAADDGKTAEPANGPGVSTVAGTGSLPPASLPEWAGGKTSDSTTATAPPTEMRIAATGVSTPSQPEAPSTDAHSTADATWTTQPGDLPPQGEPPQGEPVPAEPGQVTFDLGADTTTGGASDALTAGTVSAPAETATEDATANPFASDAIVSTEPAAPLQADEASTFSSDPASPFGAQTESSNAADESVVVSSDLPAQPRGDAADAAAVAEMPAIDLFGQSTGDPAPAEQPQPEKSLPPADSPFGDAPAAGLEQAPATESSPPQLLEPRDPQVMPPLNVEPFGAATADTETVTSEPATTAVTSPPARDPFPLEAGEVRVQQRAPRGTPRELSPNPFATGETATVVERSPAAASDPFAPARDVNQAVREDEVIVHNVQSGDNFWKIAQRYYGSGTSFNALAAYNQTTIPDPQRIKPGMRVLVPSEAVLAQQFPQLMSGASQTAETPQSGPPGFSMDTLGRPQYRVAKGDTLSSIAERFLGRSSRWRQVYGMNMDQLVDADSLITGMLLRLPADARQARMDRATTFGR